MSEFCYRNFRNIAFDLDGVLLDSRALHDNARNEGLRQTAEATKDNRYAQIPEDLNAEAHLHESNPYDIIGWLLHEAGIVSSEDYVNDPKTIAVVSRKNSVYKELLEAGGQPMPGATPLVRKLNTRMPGKLGVVTTAPMRTELMPFLLRSKLHRYFYDDMLVGREKAEGRLKPDPRAYEKLLENIAELSFKAVSPEDVLAVEDSSHGIESAKRAGLVVVGLAGTHSVEQLQSFTGYERPDGVAENMDHLNDMLGMAA